MTLGTLAVQLDGTLVGGGADEPVAGVAGMDTVAAGQVTFVTGERNLPEAEATDALAIIAPRNVTSSVKTVIQVDDPRAAFARALSLFDWRRQPLPGIDPSASIARSAGVHARSHVGAFVSIGENSFIGEGCVIHPHVVIGDQVEIGTGVIIYPNVTIYARVTIGANVIIHAGTVIGADGFGYQPTATGLQKIPHLGSVVIEDDVEIGANVTIDRATSGATRIGKGTKIDNLVMIAHNVQVGQHCIIISQVGIAGSSTVGNGVIIAGQAGVKDHVTIGDGARLAVRAGVTRDVPPGATLSGYPAQPHMEQLKVEASLPKVPKALHTLRALERKVQELEARLAEAEETTSAT